MKRIAAAWAVGSFSSIEAELSIISTIEIGRFSWVNSDRSWRMPSSKTAKSFCRRSVTKLLRASVTDRLRLMISMPVPKLGVWGRTCGQRGGRREEARGRRGRTARSSLFIASSVCGLRSAVGRRAPRPAGSSTFVPGRATLSSSLRFLRSGTVA